MTSKMIKITATKAVAMEIFGAGFLKVNGRTIIFTGNDGRSAFWSCSSKSDAERQLGSWRRMFAQEEVA